ncbi:3-deoxy-D-manno-octulosonic-acid transferase [Fibrobacter sp. UWR3]|uniref:glycosyltransferase N-terminal domain-containing protein n=1 Tax=Fibrobacter sp. UWR3 TaxID=1896217 RepID=UPI0009112DDD|nr:glycosyltransferase N-terminal domain-containing protein [Fibrobacter sp. UWR3]SHN04846.1 3-deoxy-D-manno-octulosonic-acid transferase [Fibrobacter sp. UWR3]
MFNAIDFARFAIGTAAKAVAKVPAVNTRFHIGDRLNGPWPEGPFLWMHGASLGECKMLLNLAKFLQEDIANLPWILITTQKVEVVEFLQESGGQIEAAIAPADTQTAMKAFVKKVKPVALVLAENELWPGYISTMRTLSVKPSVAIVSGRYRSSFPGIDFSPVGFASMQTGGDLSRFMNVASKANIANTMIGGDWKILPWVRAGKDIARNENPTIDTVFVSMHMAEWASLSRMIVSSIKRQESVVLIPRRLTEVEAFRKALLEQELLVVDWPLVQKGTVSIVTHFGLTKDVFSKARTAIVGGSFSRGIGVHDFWEPLQMGVATCIGPFATGQKENVAALVREGVLTQLMSTAGYARRNLPDPKLVSTFLTHEKAKIQDSYRQFVEYIRSIIPQGAV